jgi:hypothetical protein
MKPFSIISKVLASTCLAATTLFGVSVARAQTPPPGALVDLGVTYAGAKPQTGYVFFSTSFIAVNAVTTVSFAFREVPAYFGIDDVSVTQQGSSTNLLLDPGFETSTENTHVPDQWGRWIQPIDVSAIGTVASTSFPYGCSNIGPHSGSTYWCDGSVEGYDAIYQDIATTIGQTYDIGFWLADNSGGSNWSIPGIDALVYATNGIPGGTQSVAPPPPVSGVPEPEELALVGIGLAGLVSVRRQKSKG